MRVSKITSQRTRPWNVERRQLTKKGDFGVCEGYILFYVARRELTKVDLGVCEVYIISTSWY